ncbi:uncharacterized protein Dsimw501_GD28290 [Drosophila simulans]|uniref:Uncharacterized protein n=1 Tax=Drosophila simulans TaxID=7240 RepID=A0A0J9RRX3_DROSI|nr:uncharacterized protein Dsimw501_GD28290 [Drosophila simulans]
MPPSKIACLANHLAGSLWGQHLRLADWSIKGAASFPLDSMEMCDGTPGQLHVFRSGYWGLEIVDWVFELDCSPGLPVIVALNQRI